MSESQNSKHDRKPWNNPQCSDDIYLQQWPTWCNSASNWPTNLWGTYRSNIIGQFKYYSTQVQMYIMILLQSVPGYCFPHFLMNLNKNTHTCQRSIYWNWYKGKNPIFLRRHFIYFYMEKLTWTKTNFLQILIIYALFTATNSNRLQQRNI